MIKTWQLLQKEPKFFIHKFEQNADTITHEITNFKHIWLEVISISQLAERSKELNSLIEFDSQTILTTIVSGTAHTQTISEDDGGGSLRLDVKYYINKSRAIPFKFFWNLTRCSAEQKITSNLLKLTLGCNDDNDREACDILEVCNACSEDVQQMVCANNKILVENDEGGTIVENNLNRTDGIFEEIKETKIVCTPIECVSPTRQNVMQKEMEGRTDLKKPEELNDVVAGVSPRKKKLKFRTNLNL